jgi:hypothetical protein
MGTGRGYEGNKCRKLRQIRAIFKYDGPGAVLNVKWGGRGPFLRVEVRVGAQVNFIIGLEATRNETEVITGIFHKMKRVRMLYRVPVVSAKIVSPWERSPMPPFSQTT